jgi:hypothetical protein
MSVRDEWFMECPECGSDESIHIDAIQKVSVRLCVDGTDSDGGDTEWSDDSYAECTECGYEATVKDFTLKPDKGEDK